jgi:hypothetical protein
VCLVGVSGFDSESTDLGARPLAGPRQGEEPLKAQDPVQRRRCQPGGGLEAAPELALGDEQRGGHRCDAGPSTRRQPSDALGDHGVRSRCAGESLPHGSLQVRRRLRDRPRGANELLKCIASVAPELVGTEGEVDER